MDERFWLIISSGKIVPDITETEIQIVNSHDTNKDIFQVLAVPYQWELSHSICSKYSKATDACLPQWILPLLI